MFTYQSTRPAGIPVVLMLVYFTQVFLTHKQVKFFEVIFLMQCH